jgi:hypothetical protein
VSNARIYSGFHYRFSTEVANDMGRKIAELTVTTQLGRADGSAPPTRGAFFLEEEGSRQTVAPQTRQ